LEQFAATVTKDQMSMHGRATMKAMEAVLAGSLTDPAIWADTSSIAKLRDLVDQRLGVLVSGPLVSPVSLNRAVRHSLLAPAKRVRPLLTMLAAAEFSVDPMLALDAGCAVELVHTASLVLDDLPCMDNAGTRRGQASTHAVFGEATALLAAISMLTQSFGVLANMQQIGEATRAELVDILSHASGGDGLAAGQERDLNDRSPDDGLSKIHDINHLKTGALFVAALQMGGKIAMVGPDVMASLDVLGREVGLAFQTLDDVIDLSCSTSEAGKDTGKDAGKATVATVLGLDAARGDVADHMACAMATLDHIGTRTGPLGTFVSAMFAKASASSDKLLAGHSKA
jgi:geranylgeranyl diphosphate synthase, type II